MTDTWIYIIWALVSVLLLAILIALVLVCLRHHRFATIRTKFVNILSMKNYEEDDLYQYEGEVFQRRMNNLNKSTEDNLGHASSTEKIFESRDHVPIPRVGQIKIEDNSKTVISDEALLDIERAILLRAKQKSQQSRSWRDSVIHNPSAGVREKETARHTSSLEGLSESGRRQAGLHQSGRRKGGLNQSDLRPSGPRRSRRGQGGAVVIRANEVGSQLNPDFSPSLFRFPRARLVNLIGKHGSAQITVSQDKPHHHTPKSKKRSLPVIDPVENKPVKLRKNTTDHEDIIQEEIPRIEKAEFTFSSSPSNIFDEKKETPSKPQTQYDRRGRPVKPQTRKPSQIIVHEEIAPGIVIINKKRASKKNISNSRKGSTYRKDRTNEKPSQEQQQQQQQQQQQHVLHEQFILQRNEGINRKNKPSPLNLALPSSAVLDFASQIHEQRNVQQNDKVKELVNELDLHSDFESIERGEAFSPELQWKLKGDSNVYELVRTL